MFKIQSIKKLEEYLLKDSSLEDMHGKQHLPKKQNPKKTLTADEVRHDISVLARYLIRVYVGWPVHNSIVKRRVLTRLIKAYDSAEDMTAGEFFDLIKGVIEPIPDNHITIKFNGYCVHMTIKTRTHKNVGKNIAGKFTVKGIMLDNNIAAIGFTGMHKTDEFHEVIKAFQKNVLPKSNALIIDLRGNGGGNSFYSDQFTDFLCGTRISSMKKTYVRTTPEARKILQETNPNASWANVPESEEIQLFSEGKVFKIDKNKAYMKPIFILIDECTGSAAEMFLLRMVHHPMVTVVGDNSRGMEVYGNISICGLPHSDIAVSVGTNYRILEYNNFELHGLKPDIKCKDGIDAKDIAIDKINHDIITKKIKDKNYSKKNNR